MRKRAFAIAFLVTLAVIVGVAWLKIGAPGTIVARASPSDFPRLVAALEMYRNITGDLPTQSQGFQALVERPVDLLPDKKWQKLMTDLPLDPWGHPYLYLRNDRYSGGFGIYSMGKDGISCSAGNDEDDLASWRR